MSVNLFLLCVIITGCKVTLWSHYGHSVQCVRVVKLPAKEEAQLFSSSAFFLNFPCYPGGSVYGGFTLSLFKHVIPLYFSKVCAPSWRDILCVFLLVLRVSSTAAGVSASSLQKTLTLTPKVKKHSRLLSFSFFSIINPQSTHRVVIVL